MVCTYKHRRYNKRDKTLPVQNHEHLPTPAPAPDTKQAASSARPDCRGRPPRCRHLLGQMAPRASCQAAGAIGLRLWSPRQVGAAIVLRCTAPGMQCSREGRLPWRLAVGSRGVPFGGRAYRQGLVGVMVNGQHSVACNSDHLQHAAKCKRPMSLIRWCG